MLSPEILSSPVSGLQVTGENLPDYISWDGLCRMCSYIPTDPGAAYKYSASYEKLRLMPSKTVIIVVILANLDPSTR